jgi:3-oxoadipate enol-lactonase
VRSVSRTARRLERRRRAAPRWAPEPPVELPPGCVVHVPGRGELFVRDTGGEGPVVLLLHGWVVTADLNWYPTFAPLARAGYRVLALDHRGHGRGLRTQLPFRLADCAADAAALLDHLGTGPVIAAGYSMGGPIAQLMARDHPASVRGLVLSATALEWRDPRTRVVWSLMGIARLALGLAPHATWRAGLRRAGFPDSAATTWVAAELSRGSARDLAEAGRELGRFDARSWVRSLDVPAAVIVMTQDRDVPPDKQHALARALGVPGFEVHGSHLAVATRADEFNAALLRALEAVRSDADARRDEAVA